MRSPLVTLFALLSATPLAAQHRPEPTPPDPNGVWRGAGDWHRITIANGAGTVFGATGRRVCSLRFARTSARGYSGFWQAGEGRGGTFAMMFSQDDERASGWRRTDNGGNRGAEKIAQFTWRRVARRIAGRVPGVAVEVFTDRVKFAARLKGMLRTVDFDDIATKGPKPVAFAADRYAARLGVMIRGRKGQFVHRDFGFPKSYVPASKPNTYAPGPTADPNAALPLGGHETDVTFVVKGRPAAVSAFGVSFVDADHPHEAPSSLEAFDGDQSLGLVQAVRGPDGGQAFRGFVATGPNGAPVPAFTHVRIVNGNVWPEVDLGDGVTLDDFVFSTPVAR